MLTFMFCIVVLFFLVSISQAIVFGKGKEIIAFVSALLHLGLAIWGLILIVLNWS